MSPVLQSFCQFHDNSIGMSFCCIQCVIFPCNSKQEIALFPALCQFWQKSKEIKPSVLSCKSCQYLPVDRGRGPKKIFGCLFFPFNSEQYHLLFFHMFKTLYSHCQTHPLSTTHLFMHPGSGPSYSCLCCSKAVHMSIIMWETTVQNLNGKPNYTIIFMCQVFGGVLGGHHKQLYKGLGTKALSF